jgi:hypothetical protein
MGPAQLSPQRGDNSVVRERFGKPDHVPKALVGEAVAELRAQLSPQRGDNLPAILGPLELEQVLADALPDSPVEGDQLLIDLPRDALSRCRNEIAKVVEQSFGGGGYENLPPL